ncbi:uncharacterized protein RAG0_07944 [Rhynchosporium agropyri]|uniref:Uncharacterized protein n=1 Tax=Rhynchosporium agropyri TaxID=914238 RepID=A0A1E1KNN3_9HELO|nr:uncharacterized protein RAG0_07944 [Rhynchosporium agropyri]
MHPCVNIERGPSNTSKDSAFSPEALGDIRGIAPVFKKAPSESKQRASKLTFRDAGGMMKNAPTRPKLGPQSSSSRSGKSSSRRKQKAPIANLNQKRPFICTVPSPQSYSTLPTRDPQLIKRKERMMSSPATPKSQALPAGPSAIKPRSKSTLTPGTCQLEMSDGSSSRSKGISNLRLKIERRLYKPLILLSVLGRKRGDRVDEEALDEDLETSNLDFSITPVRLREGGGRATAIALEATPQGVVFWVASNKCSAGSDGGRDRMLEFMSVILNSLVRMKSAMMESKVEDVFAQAVKFSEKRIAYYVIVLGREIQRALESLTASNDGSGGSTTHTSALRSPVGICRICYVIRHSDELRTFQLKFGSDNSSASHSSSLRYAIGRLGHTMKAVDTVVFAAAQMPQLLDNFQIRRERSRRCSRPPLRGEILTLSGAVGRMTSKGEEMARYRAALLEMDQKFGLEKNLREKCTAKTWKPRVHAELLLLEPFWTKKLSFVDGDRYIGCSRFVSPAGHNNLWINWRVPDLRDQTKKAIKEREDILNKMSATIRFAVLAQINDARGPAKWKADSFTEISSIQADPTYQHEHTLRKNRLSPVSKSVGNLGHGDDQDYDDDCSNRAGDERSSELDDEENLSAEAGN